jgi:predicted phage terminase large subunit-like protein
MYSGGIILLYFVFLITMKQILKGLNKNQLDILKYTSDPVLFAKDIVGLEVNWFHKQWLNAFENNRFLVLLAPRGHGKCLQEGTRIEMPDGSFKNIEDITSNDKVLGKNNKGQIVPLNVNGLYNNGLKDVYKVTLSSGRTLNVTANHPFLTNNGWVSIDNGLKENSYVASPRKIERIKTYKTFTDNEIKVIGYLLAEGCITGNTELQFSNTNEEIVNDMKLALNDFDAKLNLKDKKKNKDYSITNSKRIKSLLKKINLYGTYSYNKFIPNEILKSPNYQLRLLLSILWKCDGTINVNHRKCVDISYSTSSKQLADDIQHILNIIGIQSNIYKHTTNKLMSYQVVILSPKENKLRFLNKILDKKNYDVKKYLDIKSHTNIDLIPKSLVIKNLNSSPWKLRQKFGIRIDNKYNITRKKLKQLVDIEKDNQNLRQLYNSNIRWIKIKSIEYIGKKQTYGIEVDKYHNHITNGVITHNTTIVGTYILWRILKDRNIRALIVTINQDKANSMMTFIQENITKNEKLRNLFGDLKGSMWSRDQIRVKYDGKGVPHNEPTLKVLGVGSRVISAHYDLIVLDDITDEENSKTEHRRRELEEWYNGPLVGTFMRDIQVINIGTRWNEDDIHSYLMNKAGYKTIKYQALMNEEEYKKGKEEAKVLWPDMKPWDRKMVKEVNIRREREKLKPIPENTLTLQEIREHQGETFFQTQYQNNIISSGISKFKPEWIDDAIEKYKRLGGATPLGLKKFIGVDLGGEESNSDWGVTTVIGIDSDGDIYVLDSIRSHSTINHQMDIMKGVDDKFNAARIGIDSAAMQKSMTSSAIRQNPDMPIIPVKPSRINDRDTRTDRLAVLFETKRILLNPALTHLIDELRIYPRGAHDDHIDSLCFAVEVSHNESERKIDWNRVPEVIRVSRNNSNYMIKTN